MLAAPFGTSRSVLVSCTYMIANLMIRRGMRLACLGFLFLSLFPAAYAQAAPADPPSAGKADQEFTEAVDDVLHEMSQITGLRLRAPVKKTLRSRDDIRSYVIRQMDDDKNPQQRYADARAAEAFGLLPKKFDIDHFMVDLLTE